MVEKQVFEYYDIEIKRNIVEDQIQPKGFTLSENQNIALNKINSLFKTRFPLIPLKFITSFPNKSYIITSENSLR